MEKWKRAKDKTAIKKKDNKFQYNNLMQIWGIEAGYWYLTYIDQKIMFYSLCQLTNTMHPTRR